jgi:cytochrome P450
MALPDGPKLHPVLQMARWMLHPMRFLEDGRDRYGDFFTARLAGVGPLVVVSDPEAVKEIFALGPDEGHAGKANYVLRPFLGDKSLLLLDGAPHMRHRKMMMPAFHGERMNAYGRAMIDLTESAIDAWPVGKPFEVHRPMQTITLQVILRTVFGVEEGPRFAPLAALVARAVDAVASWTMLFEFMQRDYGRFSPWGRYLRNAERVDQMLREEIRRGRREGTKGRADVLALMLDAKDDKGQPLTEEELRDELVTLLIAGHETTATSLSWALRWVLADIPLYRRLEAAVAEAVGSGPVVPEKIAKIELLDHTVREALRLVPVILMVGRILQKPMKLKGWDFPAGTAILPSIYLVQRRPDLYPRPERFDPDRFGRSKLGPSEWFPFGGGIRRCIGAAFAQYEMKMVLATLLTRVSMRLARHDIRPVRRSITMTPSHGMPIVLTAKRARRSTTPAPEIGLDAE